MSILYDQYLAKHKENVVKAFTWLEANLPEYILIDESNARWNVTYAHDASKSEADEYEAYDAYFYGNNRSYQVVQNYNRAWLLHIHRNPHHWQHWVLINDDPGNGEIVLDMPYDYIIEMICDWWAFSWANGNLLEIFKWYDDHKSYMKLSKATRKTVEDILGAIKQKLISSTTIKIVSGLMDGVKNKNDSIAVAATHLAHHGVKGMKWGVKNGPPYPIDKSRKHDKIVQDAIEAGIVSKKINPEKQKRHTKADHIPGRSYLNGDLDYAQKLVDKHGGKGAPIIDSNGNWTHKEKFNDSDLIGTHVDADGVETQTSKGMITYSKTGTHVYPRKEKDE